MGFKTDTIAAISTAMTNSGIGIVRLSGEDAFSIIDKIYKGKSPKLLSEQKSHTIHSVSYTQLDVDKRQPLVVCRWK